jgi:hypothetical protein
MNIMRPGINHDTAMNLPETALPPVTADQAPGYRPHGRRGECELLDRLVADVRAGQSRVLVLRGEPGTGKTVLLDYLAQRADGCRVARISGVEPELVILDAGPLHLRAKVADLLVQADAEPEAPHRLTSLGIVPGGAPATDPRVARPPAASFGPVPGQLIADLTGTSFAQAATRLVLEPLGMADSWFPARAPVSPDTAHGYRLERDGSFAPEPLPVFALQSAGGLWSTGPDLVRFGADWQTLLPGELAEQALRPHARQFDSAAEIGLGWLLNRPEDFAGHARAGPGGSVSLITRPSTGRASVVLTNRQVLVEPANVRLIRLAA